jgi:proline iminopeptidase
MAAIPAIAAPPEPEMVKLSTGSTVASWTIPADRPGHKTPVIFLHGGPGMYTEERRFGEGRVVRAAGFPMLYFDQAGGGRSADIPARDYTLDRAVADLEALRAAKGHDKIILWGNSWGATLAVLYTAQHPDHVAGLILTSPGSLPGFNKARDYSRTNRGKVTLGKPLQKAVGQIDRDGAAAESKLSQDEAGRLFDSITGSELIDGMQCKGKPTPDVTLPGGGNLYANRILQKALKAAKPPVIAGAKIPSLIIRGTCDFIAEDNALAYQKLLSGTYVIVPDSGHGLYDNRAVVDKAITDFTTSALAKLP